MYSLETLLKLPEYAFLNTDSKLYHRILFLTVAGSYAYGTNVEDSDLDLRGCIQNSREDLLGLSTFEQFEDANTDTVLYSLRKLIGLLIHCNPNTIELLGCRPDDYLILTEGGRKLIENRKLFLSQRAVSSFGGYAGQQLRRLENALAHDVYSPSEKERHILGSCLSAISYFHDRYSQFPEGAIKLYLDHTNQDEPELYMNVHLEHYPLRDFRGIWSDLNNIVKNYAKLNHRNKKKDIAHLNKHAMHLVRLYYMCFDILEQGKIVTYREKERDFLLSIRKGAFQNGDGTYRTEFFDLLSELEQRLEYAGKNTTLPEQPDKKKIENLVIELNEQVVNGIDSNTKRS